MSSNITHVTGEISAAGCWMQENADIGALVDGIIRNKFETFTEEALSLSKAAVLQNDLVSNVIKSLLPTPEFIFCRVFGRTRSKHCIMNRTDDPQMRLVTVFCWSSGSEGTIYLGSHSRRLQATVARNGMLEISDEALQHHDIRHHPVKMEHGGLTIIDARCGWQIMKGKCILLGFAIPDESKEWYPMPFPSALKDVVSDTMDGTGITVKAIFGEKKSP